MSKYKKLQNRYNEQFNTIQQYAFNFLRNEKKYNKKKNNEMWRGLTEGDELLACLKIFDLNCINKNNNYKMGGIGGVAIPPEHRGKGLFKKIIKKTLYELNDKDYVLSALWPFSYSFYEKFGWAQISDHELFQIEMLNKKMIKDKYKVDLNNIFPFDGNYSLLNEIQEKYYKNNANLKILRNNEWWKYRIIKVKEENYFCYIYDNNKGSQGYIIYSAQDMKNKENYFDKVMKIHEIIYTDMEAFMYLINFIFKHKSQIKKLEININDGDILTTVLKENNSFQRKIINGMMLRIIKLEKYKMKLDNSLNKKHNYKIFVKDDFLRWNNDCFNLQIDNKKISFKKIKLENSKADFYLHINNLNRLLTGYLSFKQMINYNLIENTNDINNKDINFLNTIFPVSNNYSPDYF